LANTGALNQFDKFAFFCWDPSTKKREARAEAISFTNYKLMCPKYSSNQGSSKEDEG